MVYKNVVLLRLKHEKSIATECELYDKFCTVLPSLSQASPIFILL